MTVDLHALLKLAHILSGAVLFGTGAGIAFFMWMAHRTQQAQIIAATAGIVVVADLVFTATAVVVQPITGVALAVTQGYRLTEPWLLAAYGLYASVGLCWLPVLVIQLRLRNLALNAAQADAELPPTYFALFRIWLALGVPAFIGVIAIYILMIVKPTFGLG